MIKNIPNNDFFTKIIEYGFYIVFKYGGINILIDYVT